MTESEAIKAAYVKIATLVTSILLFTASYGAFACGGFFDVDCNLRNGGLSPGNIGRQVQNAGQDVANALNELQANTLSGPALEASIIGSRNTAINGAQPIPANIRRLLTGYASEDSMNRVRYKIGDNGFVNLARLLEQGGLATAVTLIDVIVFRGPSEAADPALWAHELTHVDQYLSGVHSFAVRYARNWQSIENPAYAKQNGYLAWRQQNPVAGNSQGQPVQVTQNRFPMGFVMQACGCWGNGVLVAPEPKCAAGAVRAQQCAGFCGGGGFPYGYVCQ